MPVFIQDRFYGGIAEGSKGGYKAAFQDGIGIDYRTDPDRLQILPRLVKISDDSGGDEVTGLPKWGVEFGADKYVYDDDGKIYSINSSDAVALEHTVTDGAGQGIETFNDELWYAAAETIGKTTDLAGTPTWDDDYFTTPQYESPDYAVTASASNTYQLPTSVNEGATHKLSFTASVDNAAGLVLNVTAKGTGDWTVALHDSSNNVLATETIATADMPSSGLIRFLFASVAQITSGQTYHFHVYVSTGTSTVRASTSNDLSTAEGAVLQYLDDYDVDIADEPASDADPNGVSIPNAYAVPTAISESSTALCEFIPNLGMIKGIAVMVQDKGTSADWTLTLHDQFNNSLATATITNANLKTRGVWVQFEFSAPVELVVGATYHFHLTATNTTGTPDVVTATASDLSTAYFKTYTTILVDDDDYHPMEKISNLLAVGNGRFLLTIDDAEVLNTETLVFPKGESVRSLATIGSYLAIATWRGGSISGAGTSRLYLWDATSPTYNDFIEFDGQINAMHNDKNKLVVFHGTQCSISYYTGSVTGMRKLKNVGRNITLEVLPGAVAIYDGILHFGLANASSDSIDTAVYSYGRKDKDYPYSLNKDYPISTGNKDKDVKIGMLLSTGTGQFYVGWEDGNTGDCGIDKIDLTKQQQYADITFLRYDAKDPNVEKEVVAASLRFDELDYSDPGYHKVTVNYRFDNASSWTELGVIDPLNVAEDRDLIYKSFPQPTDTRWFEIEWQLVFESTVDTNVANIIFEMLFEKLDEFQIGSKTR